jgi:hypothetical protein
MRSSSRHAALALGLVLSGSLVLAETRVVAEPTAKDDAPKAPNNTEQRTPEQSEPSVTPPSEAEATKKHTAQGSMSDADKQWLNALLAGLGASEAQLKLVERTAERQARVMNALAREDLDKAMATYCPVGDTVLGVFDPKKSDAANVERMTSELVAQLPAARQLGCLNHIYNDDVYSVDVKLEDIPEARRAELVRAAQEAEKAGRIERFRHPPSHPGSYHFEFAR